MCATSSIREIWYESEGFNRYRGTGWMKEPCSSCPEKEKDYGGCRCQAYMLANDPAAADPVCRSLHDCTRYLDTGRRHRCGRLQPGRRITGQHHPPARSPPKGPAA
jgi:hypothetical protein